MQKLCFLLTQNEYMTKISINIITKNRSRLLKRALYSIFSQKYSDFEIIIIDDDSSDDTENIIKDINDQRIKYIKNKENKKVGTLRNMALNSSSGEYIAVLDDDDYWIDKNKLLDQIQILKNNEYILIGTIANLINNSGEIIGIAPKNKTDKKIRKKITSENQFIHSTVVFSKKHALMVGGYDNVSLGEDYALWLKLGKIGKICNLNKITTNYTTNNSVIKFTNKEKVKDVYKIVKKYINYYPNRSLHFLKWLYRLYRI